MELFEQNRNRFVINLKLCLVITRANNLPGSDSYNWKLRAVSPLIVFVISR